MTPTSGGGASRLVGGNASELGLVRLQVLDRIAHGRNLLRFLVRNLAAELFLKFHDQFDKVEGIRFQILTEARTRRDFAFVHAQFVNDDCFDLFKGAVL